MALYEVITSFTFVLSKPSYFSTFIGTLNRGDIINVNSISSGWAKFDYNKRTGYVRSYSLRQVEVEPEITGSVTIRYIDEETNLELAPAFSEKTLQLGVYNYVAIDIDDYDLSNESPQYVTLTKSAPDQSVTFKYKKVLGSITIKYVDENTSLDIYPSKIYKDLKLKTYTYQAVTVDNYTLTTSQSQSVTLTKSNPNTIITFKYKKSILGSVTINYLDAETSDPLSAPLIEDNLPLGSYTFNSIKIENYTVSGSTSSTVVLTEDSPNQTINFKYNKILGSITVRYIDSSTALEIAPALIHSNLPLGTYSYDAIDISGYNLTSDTPKSAVLTETSPNQTITFNYKKIILGSVTIKYIDSSTGLEIAPTKIDSNLQLGTYSYEAITVDGYQISGESIKSIILTEESPNKMLTFNYSRIVIIKGSITVQYIDDNNNKLADDDIYSDLDLGEYSYNAKTFDGYELLIESVQSVILTESSPNQIVTFTYNKITILGSITIRYIDSSENELQKSIVFSNLPLGSYTYESINIDDYIISNNYSQTVTLTKDNPNQTIIFKYDKIDIPDDININEVPYISTYYIKPIVKPGEEVFIDYYVTDFYQKEYQKEDFSEVFTITARIEGQSDKLFTNVKAGDNQISLGSFSTEGEQKFSILATDRYGRNSHELFNFFLVRNEPEVKEYVMTEEDLKNYNIKNTDTYEEKQFVELNLTNPTSATVKEAMIAASLNYTPSSNTYLCLIAKVPSATFNNWWGENMVLYASDYNKEAVLQEATNTRVGLQKLLDDKKALGFNKVKLLSGTYRIDHLKPIYIPDKFTLDINNSTIKQNQVNYSPTNFSLSTKIIEINNCIDSHVINGIIEGDYFSHDYITYSYGSEWINGVYITSSSRYSTFENLIVKDIVGYGGGNGMANSRDNSLSYTYLNPINVGNTFKLGDIDRKTGLYIDSTIRSTCSFVNIGNHYQVGYISISRYLGYQGRAFNAWNLICHFYDANKSFIKSVDSYQYRRIRVPENAQYIRITITTTDIPSDLSIQYFRLPCHCAFKNIKFDNCRCCALAPHGMNDMLTDNCELTNSGQAATSCAFDAEDGWDMMQDCFFRQLNLHDNPKVDWLAAAGHNFVVENMLFGKVNFAPRCNSYVLRNCNSVTISVNGLGRNDRVGTGYTRVYKNTISYSGNLTANYKEWPAIMKDCTINGTTEATGNIKNACIWLRCNIGESTNKLTPYTTAILPGTFIDCYIHDKYGSNLSESFGYYKNCKLENIQGGFSGNLSIFDSELNNINLNLIRSDIISISLNNCKIKNFTFNGTADYLKNKGINFTANNCVIDNQNPLLKLLYYLTNKPITITNSTFTSSTKYGLINLSGYSNNDITKDENAENRVITLLSNTINLPQSTSLIIGYNSNNTTKSNPLAISFNNNILTPTTVLLYDDNVANSLNITTIN